MKSNTDLQFILDEYSCASYVVDYINKTNRGFSDLRRCLVDLQNEYPDQDYTELVKRVSLRVLDAVEMTTPEAAWVLLRQPMSQASRDCVFITTDVPNERMRTHKTQRQMDKEELTADSTDIWTSDLITKYEQRPTEWQPLCLAEFAARLTPRHGKHDDQGCQLYSEREVPRIIRWAPFDDGDKLNYQRCMVLLFHPFTNEQIDLLDNDMFVNLFEEFEGELHRRRRIYEKYFDFEQRISENHALWDLLEDFDKGVTENVETSGTSAATQLHEVANDDIRLQGAPSKLRRF